MKRTIQIEKLRAYMKIPKEVQTGFIDDDFVRNLLTVELEARIAVMGEQSGTVTVIGDRPTFLDWLLRRRKTYHVPYDIQQLIKWEYFAPQKENISIFIIDI